MIIPKEITSDLAEETGWHIGDGSMNYYINKGKNKGVYQLRGHIIDDKQHYLVRIKPLFESLYNLSLNLREMPSDSVFGFQIWNDDLVEFKYNLGLPLGRKTDVAIPFVFLKDIKLLKAVIRGIFDTDGGIYLEKKNNKLYPRLHISTISVKLADQLIKIFSSLGFRVTKHSELSNKKYNRQRSYIISIRGIEMFDKFMIEIQPKNPKHIQKYEQFLDSKTL